MYSIKQTFSSQRLIVSTLIFWVLATAALAQSGYPGVDGVFPFAPAAGQAGSTAISKEDTGIANWATGYTDLDYGTNLDEIWKTPEKALGPAAGGSFDIVALGRGGSITLTFSQAIQNGSGPDFAVFENSINDTFLELAWVEVSTDGIHFVRFPNFSFTPDAVGGFGDLDPTFIHGFAGKYRQSFGTPFDLEQLDLAHAAIQAGTDHFSTDYETTFLANFPHLDLDEVNYVRLIDIVGDGATFDSEGDVIYDPFPTVGSAGFDLDAVAVLNERPLSGIAQSIAFAPLGNQVLSQGSVALQATATSGLPVEFEVLSGPATLFGDTLSFGGLGQVVVRALQSGDVSFAPASSVTRSFYVADALQHIYLQPIGNQLVAADGVQLYARSSSGLPVSLFVDEGPSEAIVDAATHLFTSGSHPGFVTVRALQPGGQISGLTYAPAEDVYATFSIVDASDPEAPLSFTQWQAMNALAGGGAEDADSDGATDFEEYAMNTDPNDAADRAQYGFCADGEGFVFQLFFSGRAQFRMRLFENDDLSNQGNWSEVVPKVLESESSDPGERPIRTLRLQVPRDGAQKFWRFVFEEL